MVNQADLDMLVGEVLPQRTVLSTVTTPFNNAGGAGGGPSSAAAAAAGGAGGDSGGTTALSSCQTTYSAGTPGLLGSLGLGSANPGSTTTCVPTAVSGH
ncbi:hypothetical protein [Pseudonocardia sediminis]|nr:hypothetical protein [Pseudonocardia sediminis]